MDTYKKKLLLVLGWFFLANVLAFTIALSMLAQTLNNTPKVLAYSVFASKPFVTASISEKIGSEDTRAAIIDHYFTRYGCPLAGTGQKMVEASDKYGFEFWWLPAIAWQESTCGKVMIPNSFNAWGYGIYGDRVTKFASWDEAIDHIAKDLNKNFFARGLTEPCEFEKRYTPPSKGRWCKSIKYFRDEMLDYKTH